MSKVIFLISALVLVVAGLLFLVVPFGTLEDWGIVIGNRTGNMVTGIVCIIVGGILGYLAIRKGFGRKGAEAKVPEKPVTPVGPAPATPGAPKFVTPSTPAAPAAPSTPTAPAAPTAPSTPAAPEAPKPPVPPAQ